MTKKNEELKNWELRAIKSLGLNGVEVELTKLNLQIWSWQRGYNAAVKDLQSQRVEPSKLRASYMHAMGELLDDLRMDEQRIAIENYVDHLESQRVADITEAFEAGNVYRQGLYEVIEGNRPTLKMYLKSKGLTK